MSTNLLIVFGGSSFSFDWRTSHFNLYYCNSSAQDLLISKSAKILAFSCSSQFKLFW